MESERRAAVASSPAQSSPSLANQYWSFSFVSAFRYARCSVPRWSHNIDWKSPTSLTAQIRATTSGVNQFKRKIATMGTVWKDLLFVAATFGLRWNYIRSAATFGLLLLLLSWSISGCIPAPLGVLLLQKLLHWCCVLLLQKLLKLPPLVLCSAAAKVAQAASLLPLCCGYTFTFVSLVCHTSMIIMLLHLLWTTSSRFFNWNPSNLTTSKCLKPHSNG
ncbi:aconitate hydratase [Sarracenia purpurea var. burkii]